MIFLQHCYSTMNMEHWLFFPYPIINNTEFFYRKTKQFCCLHEAGNIIKFESINETIGDNAEKILDGNEGRVWQEDGIGDIDVRDEDTKSGAYG